jgi:hypothetical protein
VSAAVKTTVVEVSVEALRSSESVLCEFQTSSQPGLDVQIGTVPYTIGSHKYLSLATIKDQLRNMPGSGPGNPGDLTSRITEHPEWGNDAFSVVLFESGRAEGVEDWMTKYSSAINDLPGKVSESAYRADATNLGDALADASK